MLGMIPQRGTAPPRGLGRCQPRQVRGHLHRELLRRARSGAGHRQPLRGSRHPRRLRAGRQQDRVPPRQPAPPGECPVRRGHRRYGPATAHRMGPGSGRRELVPDGRWILFTKPGGKLYVARPDGSGLRRIPLDTGPGRSFAFQPGWSPNGERIVFSMALASAGYQEDIFTVRADGTDPRRVTNTPDTEEFADWGPSGGCLLADTAPGHRPPLLVRKRI